MTDPRELQVTHSRGSEEEAYALARALAKAGVKCSVHQFPEFNGNWWAICAVRKTQLERARVFACVYSQGARDALDQHYGRAT